MPVTRNLSDDSVELRRETHVEHSVRLVENENLEIVEDYVLAFHVIEQSSRRSDDDIDSLSQFFLLRLQRYTAVALEGLDPKTGARAAEVIKEDLARLLKRLPTLPTLFFAERTRRA